MEEQFDMEAMPEPMGLGPEPEPALERAVDLFDAKGVDESVIAKELIERYKTLLNERSAKESVMREVDMAINCQFSEDSEVMEFRSQRFKPEIFESRQRVSARLAGIVTPTDAWISAEGRNPEAQQTEGPRTIHMRDRMHACGFQRQVDGEYIENLVDYGFSPYMVEWQTTPSQRNKQQYQWISGAGPKTYEFAPEAFDGQVFRCINPYVYVCESQTNGINSALKGFKSEMSRAEFDDLVKQGIYKDIPEGSEAPSKSADPSDANRTNNLSDHGINKSEENQGPGDLVVIHWFHGTRTIGGEAFVDWVWVVANESHLIRCQPNWYDHGQAPLRHDVLLPDADDAYGKGGLVERALPDQDFLNIGSNQWADGMSLILNPMWLALKDAIDDSQLVAKPGAVIEVRTDFDDIRKVLQAIHPDTTVLAAAQQMAESRAGVRDAMFDIKDSQATRGDATATEIASSAQERGAVLQLFAARIESNLTKVVEMFDSLEKQFYDPRGPYPYVRSQYRGKVDFDQVTPEIIYQDYNWRALGTDFMQSRNMQMSFMAQLAQLYFQDPELRAGMDVDEFGRAFIRLLGRTDAAEIYPGAEAMAQRRMAEQMQQPQGPEGSGSGGAQGPGAGQGIPGLPPVARGPIPNAGGAANQLDAERQITAGSGGIL